MAQLWLFAEKRGREEGERTGMGAGGACGLTLTFQSLLPNSSGFVFQHCFAIGSLRLLLPSPGAAVDFTVIGSLSPTANTSATPTPPPPPHSVSRPRLAD